MDNSRQRNANLASMAAMTRARGLAVDPRLLIGIILVAASVAGVWAIVAAADETVAVYSASEALSPGERASDADFDEVRVRMDSAQLYLAPGSVPADGVVITKPVAKGELIPLSAAGSARGVRMTSLVLDVEGQLAGSVAAGSSVDVWAAHESKSGVFDEPTTLVTNATVVRLVQSQAIVGAGQTTAVEVLVPRAKVASVLEAIANSDAIAVVPATLPLASALP